MLSYQRLLSRTGYLKWYKYNWKDKVEAQIQNELLNLYSKKEVIQPHLPVRLPCYDLALVIGFTLGRSLR